MKNLLSGIQKKVGKSKKFQNTKVRPVSVKKLCIYVQRYNVENSWWEGAYIHIHKKNGRALHYHNINHKQNIKTRSFVAQHKKEDNKQFKRATHKR